MNPQLVSALTTFGGYAASGIATYAVTVGVVPASGKEAFVNALVSVGGYAISAGVLWWKSRQHTPAALTKAVNSSAAPGVKVVPETSSAVAVHIDSSGKIVPASVPVKP